MVSFKKLTTPLLLAVLATTLAGCSASAQNINLGGLGGSTHVSAKYSKDVSALAKSTYQSNTTPVVNVNGGKSTLGKYKWATNHVHYADLDGLNRTSGHNIGYLEKRNVANDELRTEQTFKPTAWHQKFINNEAIINRGHEIAYSLSKGIAQDGSYNPKLQSGDQNNPKNLFTQTAWSNQRLQTVYETKVRNALKANKKVIYEVTPIFNGADLMAKGVQIQALSTDGTLNFNVFIYNVQPGVVFNYKDGTSKADRNMKVPAIPGSPTFNDSKSDKKEHREVHHHYFRDAFIAHEIHKHMFKHKK